eukprot:9704724-Alexandrium_andersonii.AAC.1
MLLRSESAVRAQLLAKFEAGRRGVLPRRAFDKTRVWNLCLVRALSSCASRPEKCFWPMAF